MATNIVDRILAKIIHDTNDCWNFIGALDKGGYGKVICRKWRGRTLAEKVHRIMYYAFKGDIPADRVVRHTCDNPRCCNPDHLVLGSQKDNVHDQIAKGRHTTQRRAMAAPF